MSSKRFKTSDEHAFHVRRRSRVKPEQQKAANGITSRPRHFPPAGERIQSFSSPELEEMLTRSVCQQAPDLLL